MHVISRKRLREFWDAHPRAKEPLSAWFARVRKADWKTFADVKKDYGSADTVGRFVVFNIGGNKYRLIVVVHFNRGKLYIRHVLTHRDYDRGGWKG